MNKTDKMIYNGLRWLTLLVAFAWGLVWGKFGFVKSIPLFMFWVALWLYRIAIDISQKRLESGKQKKDEY